MSEVTLTGVSAVFDGTVVLRGVDLQVPSQRLTAVLGPSGCGKTTMLRLIAGFIRPQSGSISLGGRVVASPDTWVPPQRRRVGYVPQEGALFPHLSVADNIGFGLPRRARRDRDRVDELLELVGLPSHLRTRQPHELSGGQQQRVALARALAPSPSVVLLDEPFASLDAGLREGTGRAVAAALRAAQATAVLVTHDQGEALSLADQVAVMREGRLVQAGSPQDVYAAPADVGVAQFVGAAVVLDAEVSDGMARTALGRVAVGGGSAGGVCRVLLRPEQLVLTPLAAGAPNDRAAVAVVTDVSFYGHDVAVRLELLQPPLALVARLPGTVPVPAAGERVAVHVHGTGLVFPGDEPACGDRDATEHLEASDKRDVSPRMRR